MINHFAAQNGGHVDGNEFVFFVQVGQGKHRNSGQRFRRVGRFLAGFQLAGVVDDGLQFGLAERSADIGQMGDLFVFLPLAQPGIRLQQNGSAVWVLQQIGANEVLEVSGVIGEVGFNGRHRPFIFQRRKWITAVSPGSQRPHHQANAARERAGVVLAQAEFDAVNGRFHHVRLKSLCGDLTQHLFHQSFHFAGVCLIHALQTDRKRHLPQIRRKPAAG